MLTRDIHSNNETVSIALYELTVSINLARKDKDKLLCLITGYGSSGKTHKIKTAIIEKLEELKAKKQIKGYLIGSELDIFNLNYQGFSHKDKIPKSDFNRPNPGVIYIGL